MAAPVAANSRLVMHFAVGPVGGPELMSTFGDRPETFRMGDGLLPCGFEQLLLGRIPGARDVLEIPPEQAFGPWEAGKTHWLDRAGFTSEAVPGAVVAFDLPSGEQTTGTVIAVEPERVQVDFNHPLAGQPVRFRFEILDTDP